MDVSALPLSPAINDPTTAVQTIDQLEDLLRRLGAAELDAGYAADENGVPLKMALYRDLQKDSPEQPGFVSFPSGLDDEYFQELVSERRTPVKRHGFTVYRWTKDDRQDNEALDTMIQATGAALKFGVYGLSDVGWDRLEAERLPTARRARGRRSQVS